MGSNLSSQEAKHTLTTATTKKKVDFLSRMAFSPKAFFQCFAEERQKDRMNYASAEEEFAALKEELLQQLTCVPRNKACYYHTDELVERPAQGWIGVVRCHLRNGAKLVEWFSMEYRHGRTWKTAEHRGWSGAPANDESDASLLSRICQHPILNGRGFGFASLVEGWEKVQDRWADEARQEEEAAADNYCESDDWHFRR
jgi:hypothetical protein